MNEKERIARLRARVEDKRARERAASRPSVVLDDPGLDDPDPAEPRRYPEAIPMESRVPWK